jgi:hypothetical protein
MGLGWRAWIIYVSVLFLEYCMLMKGATAPANGAGKNPEALKEIEQ